MLSTPTYVPPREEETLFASLQTNFDVADKHFEKEAEHVMDAIGRVVQFEWDHEGTVQTRSQQRLLHKLQEDYRIAHAVADQACDASLEAERTLDAAKAEYYEQQLKEARLDYQESSAMEQHMARCVGFLNAFLSSALKEDSDSSIEPLQQELSKMRGDLHQCRDAINDAVARWNYSVEKLRQIRAKDVKNPWVAPDILEGIDEDKDFYEKEMDIE